MKPIAGPLDARQRRLVGFGIAGMGLVLLSHQLWQLVEFFLGVADRDVAMTSAPTSLGGVGTSLALGVLGLVMGVVIGHFMGRRKPVERSARGIVIDGEARRVRDDG